MKIAAVLLVAGFFVACATGAPVLAMLCGVALSGIFIAGGGSQ